MIAMIAGAMRALTIGDPNLMETDVGPVIDEGAKRLLDEHIEWLGKNAKELCRLPLPQATEQGCFVAPAMYEINALSDLNHENFGPILHIVRFAAEDLGKVVEAINATGYGLTLGLQSRIDTVRDFVDSHAGSAISTSMHQIGAVFESQPFGGEASGTANAGGALSPLSPPSASLHRTTPRAAMGAYGGHRC